MITDNGLTIRIENDFEGGEIMKLGKFSFDKAKPIQGLSAEFIVNIYQYDGQQTTYTGVSGYGETPEKALEDAKMKSLDIRH